MNPQSTKKNGSQIALWRTTPAGERSPVARGTIRLTVPMLQELLARAQAQQFSGTDNYSGPYVELRWSGFAVSSQNESAPKVSGPIETPSETESRLAASAAPAAPPAQQPAWGAPAPTAQQPAWGAPAAPPAQQPAWGAPAPTAAPAPAPAAPAQGAPFGFPAPPF